jgi:hypothetical protein
MDFLWGKDADKILYPEILKKLAELDSRQWKGKSRFQDHQSSSVLLTLIYSRSLLLDAVSFCFSLSLYLSIYLSLSPTPSLSLFLSFSFSLSPLPPSLSSYLSFFLSLLKGLLYY